MRKFFCILLTILYSFSTNACFAFSELYYLKNVKKAVIAPQVETLLGSEDYNLIKKNPYYAVNNKKTSDFASIVLQQSGANLFYYFESNDSNKKLNKLFLKSFEDQKIVFEKSESTMHLNNFSQIAKRTMLGEEKKYTFEEIRPIAQVKQQTQPNKPAVLKGFVGRVERGAKINVYLQTAINTATANLSDSITAVLKEDWKINDSVIAPQGSLLYGTLTKANHATLGSRNGSVQIVFNQLVAPNGKTYALDTQKIDFKVSNDGKIQRLLVKTVASAAVGAIIGLGIAAICGGNGSDMAKGALMGAGIAGGTAIAATAVEKGVDAEIPSFTDMEIVLSKPLDVAINY